MNSHFRSVSLLCLVVMLVACASGHHKPFIQSFEATRNLAALQQRLDHAVKASPFLTLQELGSITYDGYLAPIWLIKFQPASEARQHVLINAGIHGNEPAGVECLIRFIESISNATETFPDIAIDIVPIINPWGWQHDIRFNRDGIDVNRDFAALRSQESKLIQSYAADRPYDLMIDLHEDPSATGFYLYQYGRKDFTLSQDITKSIRQMGFPLEQNVNMVILKTRDGIIDAPMWGLWYMRLTRQLSIANYYRLNNSRNVFTIETPVSLDLQSRLTMQQVAVSQLLNSLSDDSQ